MIEIRRCTVAEIGAAPNLREFLDEYAAECSIAEIGAVNPQADTYHALEASGVLHPVGAFEHPRGGEAPRLVGFVLPLVIALPHYGVVTATVESFFVPQAERSRGIGLRLQAFVENLARNLGAKALLFSAPVGGPLDAVLTRQSRYRHSNNAYVMAL